MTKHFSVRDVRQPRWLVTGSISLVKSLFFLVLPAVLLLLGCSSDRTKMNETKQNGDQIIRALEQFRADLGHYPKSLTDLSPKYLHAIPSPTWGLKAWQYEGHANDFTLRVDESLHTGDGNSRWLRYQGGKWGWQIGD